MNEKNVSGNIYYSNCKIDKVQKMITGPQIRKRKFVIEDSSDESQ